MEYSKEQTVCFTGHRPKGIIPADPYNVKNRPVYQEIVNQIYEEVERLYQAGYCRYLSGGAQGFDQLAFWAVNRLKKKHPEIQNIVYKPFEGQESKWAETGLFSKEEAEKMFHLADKVHICDKTINPQKDNYRRICQALNNRNQCMVNDSSAVIGQFEDDSWKNPHTKSGTASCLRLASSMGKQILVKKFY